MNDLALIDELAPLPDGNVYIAIAKGSRENPVIVAYIAVKELGFYPMVGWELKDCQVKALPQEYRFEVLRAIFEVPNKYGQKAVVFLI